MRDKWKGWGCVNPLTGEYARGVWPDYILKHEVRNGRKWGKRLSVLEGFGAAQVVSIWAADIVEAGAAAIYVDNKGFVWAGRNGSSRDEYFYTLAK